MRATAASDDRGSSVYAVWQGRFFNRLNRPLPFSLIAEGEGFEGKTDWATNSSVTIEVLLFTMFMLTDTTTVSKFHTLSPV
jgi:hypothetical protein